MNASWIRKIGLFVYSDSEVIDLSQFRVSFQTKNADAESPNSAVIRVYNMKRETADRIRGVNGKAEFNQVVLNAGYENGNYGVVFQGTIKQFRIGRVNNIDTYIDILAADGDIGYNQGIVNKSLAAGATHEDVVKAAADSMPGGVTVDAIKADNIIYDKQHVPNIRGQVLFGMARARLRNVALTNGFTWSIQNGVLTRIPRTGYLPGEAVKINVGTGMVGMPEETDEGIKVSCLLNSRINIGGLVQLNNADIIQLMQQDPNAAPIPYNQWAGFNYNAPLSKDGYYRVFVAEHEGDTRGNSWYTHLVCLAVDVSAPQTKAVEPN